jgi:hypothetical protein
MQPFAAIREEKNKISKPHFLTIKFSHMKNLILLLLALFLESTAFGQPCSDLFVTEIVFEKVGSNLQGNATYFNHSVEIFNPTDQAIDLEKYKIALVPEEGEKTFISLEGTIPAEGVFVISNAAAAPSIDAVTDLSSSVLYLKDKVALELTKNGTVIDVLGKQGLGATASTIDLEALLNDIDYVNSLQLNLRSIEHLVVRRKRHIKEGQPVFLNENLLKEWMIYPSFEISDLGEHTGACVAPMLYWGNLNQVLWEKELWEPNGEDPGNFPASEWASGTIILSEPLDEDLDFTLFSNTFEYLAPDDEASFDDWKSVDLVNEYTIEAGQTVYIFEQLAWAIVDFQLEQPEGFGIKVVSALNGVIISDPEQDLLDIRIVDHTSKTKEQVLIGKSISAFPIAATEYINLVSSDPELKIESVQIFSLEGRYFGRQAFGDWGNESVKVDLKNVTGRGYHVLVIKTNKGVASKKFYKY